MLKINNSGIVLRKFEDKSAYFNPIALNNGNINIYFRNGYLPKTKFKGDICVSTSVDGINFSNPKSLNIHLHNVFPFYDISHKSNGGSELKMIGMSTDKMKISNSLNDNGTLWSTSKKDILTSNHPGFFNYQKKTRTKFDGSVCCIYDTCAEEFIFYTRCNVVQGSRGIQYSKSKDLKKWSPYKKLDIIGFDSKNDNYYYPSFGQLENGLFFGFLPYFNKNYSSFRMLVSKNGIKWRIAYEFMKTDLWKQIIPSTQKVDIRNKHHISRPVAVGDKMMFYVHENYFNNDGSGSHINCYWIHKNEFINFVEKSSENI